MLQRRQFLGTLPACLGAGFAGAAFGRHLVANEPNANQLKWHCDIIPSVAHNKAGKRPVVTGVSLQPNGNLLAIVGDDHHVSLYDTQKREYTLHLDKHTDWVRAARFSADGSLLVTAGNDRSFYIWDTNRLATPKVSRDHDAAIIELAISNDGSQLATVGFERRLHIYDIASGRKVTQLECACNDNHAVAFSQDGKRIAAAGRCGRVKVWDLATESIVAQQKIHRKRIRSLAFTIDGHVITGSDDQTVGIFNPEQPDELVMMPRLASKLYAVETMKNGLLATAGSDNRIHVWQLESHKLLGTLGGHTGTVSCLDYSQGKLVSGSYDTHVRLWHTERVTQLPNGQGNPTGRWNHRLN